MISAGVSTSSTSFELTVIDFVNIPQTISLLIRYSQISLQKFCTFREISNSWGLIPGSEPGSPAIANVPEWTIFLEVLFVTLKNECTCQ
jgi:hypothetical protein